jgi:hypothetical protein
VIHISDAAIVSGVLDFSVVTLVSATTNVMKQKGNVGVKTMHIGPTTMIEQKGVGFMVQTEIENLHEIRAKEKELSRQKDRERLEKGEITPEELQKENNFFKENLKNLKIVWK